MRPNDLTNFSLPFTKHQAYRQIFSELQTIACCSLIMVKTMFCYLRYLVFKFKRAVSDTIDHNSLLDRLKRTVGVRNGFPPISQIGTCFY